MSGPVGATSKRVGGKSTGENAPWDKSGYADRRPNPTTIGNKKGLTRGNDAKGYSGPEVAKKGHPGVD